MLRLGPPDLLGRGGGVWDELWAVARVEGGSGFPLLWVEKKLFGGDQSLVRE